MRSSRKILSLCADDLDSVGEPHAGHFSQRRIRLLGSGSVHARTNSALLRAAIQRRAGSFPAWRFPPITHKLVKRWHEFPLRDEKSKSGATRLNHGTSQSPKTTDRNSEDYLLRTGPCSIRRNRWNLGASPPAGPAYRRVVAQEQKADLAKLFNHTELAQAVQLPFTNDYKTAGSRDESGVRRQSFRAATGRERSASILGSPENSHRFALLLQQRNPRVITNCWPRIDRSLWSRLGKPLLAADRCSEPTSAPRRSDWDAWSGP